MLHRTIASRSNPMAATKTPKKPSVQAETAYAATAAQVEETTTKFFNGFDELTQLGQENFEAVVAANHALAKGAEEISKEIFGIAQSTFEHAAHAAKALFSAKTLPELIELNNRFAKSSVDSFLANSAKLSEISLKVANEAAQPLKARVDLAIEKLGKPLAA
jgi:phasin family protein